MSTYLGRLRRAHWRLGPILDVTAAIGILIWGFTTGHNQGVLRVLWALGLWLAVSLACGALYAYLATSNRKMRESRLQFEAKMQAELTAILAEHPAATPHAACICPTTAAGLDLCDRCPGRNP